MLIARRKLFFEIRKFQLLLIIRTSPRLNYSDPLMKKPAPSNRDLRWPKLPGGDQTSGDPNDQANPKQHLSNEGFCRYRKEKILSKKIDPLNIAISATRVQRSRDWEKEFRSDVWKFRLTPTCSCKTKREVDCRLEIRRTILGKK